MLNSSSSMALPPATTNDTPVFFTQSWLEPRLVVATLILIVMSFVAENQQWASSIILLLNIASYLTGGWFGFWGAVHTLSREHVIDVDLLMILAALGAAVIGEWHEGAILLFLFSLSNVLQDYAIGRSRKAIQSLMKLYPEEATLKRGDQFVTIKASEIQPDDLLLLKPGERVPVDAMVIAGNSSLDESSITGESIPVDKGVGSTVFAGTLNGHGSLELRATGTAQETVLARVIQMVENAQESKAPTQRFLEMFERRYAVAILAFIALFITIPPLFGVPFVSNFYRAMVLMTVASPCALVISTPASFISAIAAAARNGVLFKGGAHLELFADIKAVTFDKTGTLTIGQPQVTDLVPFSEHSNPLDLLQLVASVESHSEHPLARAVVRYAQTQEVKLLEVADFRAVVGRGVEAQVDGQVITIGSAKLFSDQLSSAIQEQVERLESDGKTVMLIQQADRFVGLVALADQLRPESKAVIASLKQQGVLTVMLTGDNQRVANAIGKEVGIDRIHAELLPSDKAQIIEQLQHEVGSVAMIGDGVNDAPALAVANIGIAMGVAGSDVALETADIVLMGDRLPLIDYAFQLSRKARRVVWQNIAFSLAVIGVLVVSVFLINLPLPFGVFGHEGSTVIVVLNGLFALLILPEINRRRQERKIA